MDIIWRVRHEFSLNCQQRAVPTTPKYKINTRKWTSGVERLMRRLQLVLWHHHSLAFLPSNYCLPTTVLSYSLLLLFSHISPPSLGLFYLPLPLIVSTSSSTSLFFLSVSSDQTCAAVSELQMWEMLDQLAAAAWTHRHKDALIYGICGAMCTPWTWVAARSRGRTIKEIVRVLYVRTALKHVYLRMCVICVCKSVCVQKCWWSMFTADCWTLWGAACLCLKAPPCDPKKLSGRIKGAEGPTDTSAHWTGVWWVEPRDPGAQWVSPAVVAVVRGERPEQGTDFFPAAKNSISLPGP